MPISITISFLCTKSESISSNIYSYDVLDDIWNLGIVESYTNKKSIIITRIMRI
jgi:hypothetical protein